MSLELSIPINIGQLGQSGRTIRQMVDKETCAGISSRLAVNAIEEFFIDIFIQKDSETKLTVTVDGSIKATVIQSCSVTLEPIISKLSIPVSLTFAEKQSGYTTTEDVDLEKPDPPELMHMGQFDIGDILVQMLAVEVNPFPRKPGSSLEDIPKAVFLSGENGKEGNLDHPFTKLAEFKKKLKTQ